MLQAGAVSRRQLLEAGATTAWVSRRVASGRWQRLQPGVFVTHDGPVLWRSRVWAALLYAGPDAALSHASAASAHGFVGQPPRVVDVSIPATRVVAPQAGLRVHRRRDMPRTGGRPPAVERGATVVDLTDRLVGTDDVVGLVCAAIRARARPREILAVIGARARVRHRALLVDLLGEVASGIESPLERRYHHDVERRHRLPGATLQVRQNVAGRWIRADGVYVGLGVRVELDGELAHPGGRTDDDVWRDNAVVVARDEITLRYRWRHVAGDPCACARQVEQALRSRAGTAQGLPCGPTCPVGA